MEKEAQGSLVQVQEPKVACLDHNVYVRLAESRGSPWLERILEILDSGLLVIGCSDNNLEETARYKDLEGKNQRLIYLESLTRGWFLPKGPAIWEEEASRAIAMELGVSYPREFWPQIPSRIPIEGSAARLEAAIRRKTAYMSGMLLSPEEVRRKDVWSVREMIQLYGADTLSTFDDLDVRVATSISSMTIDDWFQDNRQPFFDKVVQLAAWRLDRPLPDVESCLSDLYPWKASPSYCAYGVFRIMWTSDERRKPKPNDQRDRSLASYFQHVDWIVTEDGHFCATWDKVRRKLQIRCEVLRTPEEFVERASDWIRRAGHEPEQNGKGPWVGSKG